MKKLLLACACALSLSACGTLGALDNIGTQAPAPLANTVIDDTGLEAAWQGYEAALDGINLWLDLAPKNIGTPKARAIAAANDKVLAAFKAAERAAAALSTTSYASALIDVKAALTELRLAMKGN